MQELLGEKRAQHPSHTRICVTTAIRTISVEQVQCARALEELVKPLMKRAIAVVVVVIKNVVAHRAVLLLLPVFKWHRVSLRENDVKNALFLNQ